MSRRLSKWSARPRPTKGPATLDLGDLGTDAVEIVEILALGRCRIRFGSGSELIVSDGLLR